MKGRLQAHESRQGQGRGALFGRLGTERVGPHTPEPRFPDVLRLVGLLSTPRAHSRLCTPACHPGLTMFTVVVRAIRLCTCYAPTVRGPCAVYARTMHRPCAGHAPVSSGTNGVAVNDEGGNSPHAHTQREWDPFESDLCAGAWGVGVARLAVLAVAEVLAVAQGEHGQGHWHKRRQAPQ